MHFTRNWSSHAPRGVFLHPVPAAPRCLRSKTPWPGGAAPAGLPPLRHPQPEHHLRAARGGTPSPRPATMGGEEAMPSRQPPPSPRTSPHIPAPHSPASPAGCGAEDGSSPGPPVSDGLPGAVHSSTASTSAVPSSIPAEPSRAEPSRAVPSRAAPSCTAPGCGTPPRRAAPLAPGGGLSPHAPPTLDKPRPPKIKPRPPTSKAPTPSVPPAEDGVSASRAPPCTS